MSKNGEKGLAYQLMDISEHALYVFAKDDFHIVYANPKAKEIFGENLELLTCYQGIETKQLPCMGCPFILLRENQEYITERYLESFDMRVNIKANELLWDDGCRVVLCKILDSEALLRKKIEQGVEMQKAYAEKLRLSGELYQTVVNQLKTVVFECNYDRNTSYTSPLFKEKFGVEEILDIDFLQNEGTAALLYEEDIDTYRTLFSERKDDFREVTCRLKEITGDIVWYRICLQFIRDENGNLIRAIGTLKDVDEITKSNESLRYRSEYDTLTNIPNVNRFYVDAGHLIQEHGDKDYAIISFDIDKFKLINDLFGMKTGDEVLKHVADVIRERASEDSLYCRVHSDMFILCVSYEKRGDLIKLIEKIRKGIYRNGFSFDINTSFGIYLVTDASIPINLMCDRANLASKTVKGSAMKFCAFYDEQYRTDIIKTTEIEKDMNLAISDKQFLMYLQPKYNLITGKVCGAEALVRWQHPVKGLIPPMDFIPLFERNGFILKLDEYMWEEACKTIARWLEEGKKPLPISVNISRYHIKNNDLVAVWQQLIRKYNVPTSSLILELTETFFYDSEDLYEVLVKLQDMGFKLEVDDFGAGYSSLNMIRQIPINAIKIDKDFLDKKLASDKGKIVVRHTIAMAKDLQLDVVAEGVETKEHVEFLKSSDCDVAQGYFFAKPMPVADFEKMYYGES